VEANGGGMASLGNAAIVLGAATIVGDFTDGATPAAFRGRRGRATAGGITATGGDASASIAVIGAATIASKTRSCRAGAARRRASANPTPNAVISSAAHATLAPTTRRRRDAAAGTLAS
jgi:hypothetical protein